MAGSTKTGSMTTIHSEPERREARSSSAPHQSEGGRQSPIILPGLDEFYEFFFRYGAALLLFATLVFFAWALWSIDFSAGM